MNAKWYAITAVIVIIVAAAAGFGGYSYGLQQGQTRAQDVRNQFLAARGLGGDNGGAPGANGQAVGGGGGGRQFNANNFVSGQVKSVDGNTIQLSTATEVLTVKLNGQTQIQKMGQGTVGDIQPNERITIQGTRASDGTFSAQSIQIGNRGFGGAGGAQGGAVGGSGRPAGGAAAPNGTPAAQGNATP